MTLVWPTQRQALEWVFIGMFVLAACLLLVPHGNAASVKVPPGKTERAVVLRRYCRSALL